MKEYYRDMPQKDAILSDYYRVKTLDTLLAAGVYVNDYPGFVLERKNVSYFFVRFSPEEMCQKPSNPKKRINEFLAFVDEHNEKNKLRGTEREIKVFYLDEQGTAFWVVWRMPSARLCLPSGRRK